MITSRVIRSTTGVPLTDSGGYGKYPWSDSPLFPAANEQAPTPTLARPDVNTLQISWSPESGRPAQADLWVEFAVESPQHVTQYQIDWGDGSTDTELGYGLPAMRLQLSHSYYVAAANVTIRSYNALGLIETHTLAVDVEPSSWWRVHQYRILRFKGRLGYHKPSESWYPDWREFTGAPDEMTITDQAHLNWNWLYQLWLRDLDQQGLPDLTMQPSEWAQTGLGEGFVDGLGWGVSWGALWGWS